MLGVPAFLWEETMALVERLMGLNAAGTAPDDANKISVHAFFAACHEIVMGRATVAQVKSFFAMDVATAAEFDTLVATAPSGATALATAQKAQYVESMHAVCILANHREGIPPNQALPPGYVTPAQVRVKLGI